MKKILTTCPYCGTGCSYYLSVDDDNNIVGVEASPQHPVSKGRLCIKGFNSFSFVQHPQRLQHPMIRNEKGELQKVSWDEALDYTVKRLQEIQQQHGSDSLMFFSSAKTTNEENYLLMKLARAVFKTNNVDHCARLCHASTVAGLAETFGSGAMTNSIACFEKADCLFVIGANPTEQHPLIGTRILNNVRSGAKLIVADTRKIRLANFSDIHIKQRNGTDVALLNGMMHVIIRDGLENKEFIEARTENYEALKETVADYTPERVAAICEINPEQVVEAAHLYAKAKNAIIVYAMGITQHTHGVDNVRSVANLAMLTGQIGRPGAGVCPLRGQNNVQGACDMGALPNVYSGYQKVIDENARAKFEKAWGVENLPGEIGQTVTTSMNGAVEGKIKAMYIMGENPMMSDPDQHHIEKALETVDFVVLQDIFETPTAAYADVILPAASFAEKEGTFTNTERRVQRVRKAIDPVGDARPDWQILGEVAKRCGYDGMQYDDPSQIMDEIASVTPSYGGMSYERIDQEGLHWPCPTKDHPGTPVLHTEKFARGLGKFSPAEYMASMELPDDDYPLLLSTGRCYFHFHTGTMTRRTRLLEREVDKPYVEMNQADAQALNIRNGDWVIVTTRRGEVKTVARVSDNIKQGVLFMPFHFEEAPANALTINKIDPAAKIPEYKVCAAKVRKAS